MLPLCFLVLCSLKWSQILQVILLTVFLQNHPKCCQSALPPAPNLPSYLDHTLFHIDHLKIYFY